ncbi:hypothetical protein [Paraburkholderia youngii]|uniref:hypothetical protein n=1 Tax=Paraburkholderia youngii TaxID=2782701 RepID=UPI003D19CA93
MTLKRVNTQIVYLASPDGIVRELMADIDARIALSATEAGNAAAQRVLKMLEREVSRASAQITSAALIDMRRDCGEMRLLLEMTGGFGILMPARKYTGRS